MTKSNKGKGAKTKSQRKGKKKENKKRKSSKKAEKKETKPVLEDKPTHYEVRPETYRQTIFRNVPVGGQFLVKATVPLKKKSKGGETHLITNLRFKKTSASKHGGEAMDEKGKTRKFNEYQSVQFILGSEPLPRPSNLQLG